MEAPRSRLGQALEDRLAELSDEIRVLRDQQRFILQLMDGGKLPKDGALDKQTWTNLLKSSGFSNADMIRWHSEFENRSPANYLRFLQLLCIPDKEIETIRSWSHAPQEAARILKLSSRQLELLFELFTDTPRQGPGSLETTRKTLNLIPKLPPAPLVLEIGCGTGGSTLELARLTKGIITATDIYQPFLDELDRKARAAGITTITSKNMDMADLTLPETSFDLLWAESCVFIIGFEPALTSWNPLLKSGGFMVLSDVSWLVNEPDQEVQDFWATGYPKMLNINEHLSIIEATGYQCLGHFTQPESDWEAMYKPLREKRLPFFEANYPDDHQAQEIISSTYQEMGIRKKYPQQYSHEIYIMEKK